MSLSALAQRPPFTPEDLWSWREASDPRIRADGKSVVYTEGFFDRGADREWSNLWIASSDGRERRQWTDGKWRDWSPRWSPDGERVAWISDRGGTAHIRVRRLDAAAEVEIRVEGEALAPVSIVPRLRRAEVAAQVFVVAAAGGAVRQISRGAAGCVGQPAWPLDGKSVIAVCGDAVAALPVDGGAAKVLTKDVGRYESPIVSPDGGRIAYLFTERKP